MRHLFCAAVFAVLLLASVSQAAVTVDGVIGAGEYDDAIVTNIGYDPTAPVDFSAFPPNSELTAYTVWYKADATNVYVALRTNAAGVGLDQHDASLGVAFANLYFDMNPGTGSDIGFEVFNDRAFTPGINIGTYYGPISALGAQFQRTVGTTYANGGAPSTIEFAVPWSVFTKDSLGLNNGTVAPGGGLQLRLSQSFGYAPARPIAEPRFGIVNAPVPEPATWAMMIGGFGLIGGTLRRGRTLAAA